jgi:ABC-2 type transport system ATP-binding protein
MEGMNAAAQTGGAPRERFGKSAPGGAVLPAVQISGLGFSYPGRPTPLITGLNLTIGEGERFGLFGPNGAGKTTLMNLMTGLLSIGQGSIRLFGREVGKDPSVRALFGFVPQDFSFYEELSPVQNLEFFGAWAGLNRQQTRQRTTELLEILGLTEVRHQPVEQFSGGMKRRLNLAIGVIHEPPLLFLDEPTVGVDVQTGYAIIRYLKELNAQGTTLIYTSHQLNEAEGLCEKIALIDQGTIMAGGNLSALLKASGSSDLEGLFLQLTGKAYRDVL